MSERESVDVEGLAKEASTAWIGGAPAHNKAAQQRIVGTFEPVIRRLEQERDKARAQCLSSSFGPCKVHTEATQGCVNCMYTRLDALRASLAQAEAEKENIRDETLSGVADERAEYIERTLTAEAKLRQAESALAEKEQKAHVVEGPDVNAAVRIWRERSVAAEARVKVLEEALRAIQVRVAFIGMPQEPRWRPDPLFTTTVPDWRKEIAQLETALSAPQGPERCMVGYEGPDVNPGCGNVLPCAEHEPAPQGPLQRSKEWWLEKANLEGDATVGAVGGAVAPQGPEGSEPKARDLIESPSAARIAELEREEEQLRAIAERCRATKGKCFCGMHTSPVMDDPGEESKPCRHKHPNLQPRYYWKEHHAANCVAINSMSGALWSWPHPIIAFGSDPPAPPPKEPAVTEDQKAALQELVDTAQDLGIYEDKPEPSTAEPETEAEAKLLDIIEGALEGLSPEERERRIAAAFAVPVRHKIAHEFRPDRYGYCEVEVTTNTGPVRCARLASAHASPEGAGK